MNKTTEALKLAEEALTQHAEYRYEDVALVHPDSARKALATIRAARAQEQAEQEPVAWEHFGIPSVNGKHAEKRPLMDYERINALREGEQNVAEDAYFFARPENDTPSLRKMFCQGFERGFHKGLKYAAPVRTKDLTDDEIAYIWRKYRDHITSTLGFARAVIAADREKNRV